MRDRIRDWLRRNPQIYPVLGFWLIISILFAMLVGARMDFSRLVDLWARVFP